MRTIFIELLVTTLQIHGLAAAALTEVIILGDGANPAHRGQGEAESRAAPAHAREYEPGHHAGYQDLQIPDHQQQMRRASGLAAAVHRAAAPFDQLVEFQCEPGRRDSVPGSSNCLTQEGPLRGQQIHDLRTDDAERNRYRGSQRSPSRWQLRANLHRCYQAARGGSPCGAACLRGSR